MSDLLIGGHEPDGPLTRLAARLPRAPRGTTVTAAVGVVGVVVGLLVAPTVRATASLPPLPRCVATELPKVPSARGSVHLLQPTSLLMTGPGRRQGSATPATVRVSGLPRATNPTMLFFSADPVPPSALNPGSWRISADMVGVGIADPLNLQLDATDAHAGSVTFISMTTPDTGGGLTSRYVRLQAPLPFLDLKPFQSAVVHSDNCEVLVTASRPTTARRWELRLTPNSGDAQLDFLVRRIVLQTDAVRPPFRTLNLDLYLGGGARRAEVHVTVPPSR